MKIAPSKPERIEGRQPGQGLALQGSFHRPTGDQLPDGARFVVLHQRNPAAGLGQGVEGQGLAIDLPQEDGPGIRGGIEGHQHIVPRQGIVDDALLSNAREGIGLGLTILNHPQPSHCPQSLGGPGKLMG